MIKKLLCAVIVCLFIFLESCGSIIKYKYINKPVTKKLDWTIVALDGMGVIMFVIPGVIAFTIDYMTGTLFIPSGRIAINSCSNEDIQKLLKNHTIDIKISELEVGKKLALK